MCALLLVVGLLQMVGDFAGQRELKGVGAATLLSPAPRVFSAVRGYETYTTRFAIEWRDGAGDLKRLAITPAVGARLRGPYNRRNVYGAALSYGPVLASDEVGRAMLDSVLAKGFGENGPLWEELGLDRESIVSDLAIRYEPRPDIEPANVPLRIEVPLP